LNNEAAQISNILQVIKGISEQTNLLQSNGQSAVEIVQKTTDSFEKIKAELDQITDMTSQIAVSAGQQTSVANEVNERIHLIKNDSENMYEHGGQTLNSIDTLLKIDSDLKENIEVFHFK